MSTKDEEVRVKTRWRSNAKPSSAWHRLCAKIFASRKEKLADSHPESDTTAQDAGDGGQELSQ